MSEYAEAASSGWNNWVVVDEMWRKVNEELRTLCGPVPCDIKTPIGPFRFDYHGSTRKNNHAKKVLMLRHDTWVPSSNWPVTQRVEALKHMDALRDEILRQKAIIESDLGDVVQDTAAMLNRWRDERGDAPAAYLPPESEG